MQLVKQPGQKTPAPPTSSSAAAVGRKLADSTSSAAPINRKPGLGKGVPPPVPPNKPVVPVKKEIGSGKRSAGDVKDITLSLVESGKQSSVPAPSMVTGLQGLKFGISIGSVGVVDGSSSSKGIKPLGGGGGDVTTKKFFNNIESKS